MDRRKNLQQLLGQGALDGYARSREPVRADVDAWYQVSAATNLNDPTTTRETRSPMPDVSTVMLNNGVELPGLGLGVFQTPTDETRAAVAAAISAGYRHIDTAAAYGNEREVGEAVRSSGLDRSEVFLETKIWISDYRYDKTLRGFGKSARKLGVDQMDLLILHQACRRDFEATLDAYRALEALLADGRVRAIGVSTSWWSTSPRCSSAPLWCRLSTRSRSTSTSSKDKCRPSAPSVASWPRPGPRSAASPSTATGSTAAPCRIR